VQVVVLAAVRAVASTHCTMCGKDLANNLPQTPHSAGAYDTGYVPVLIHKKILTSYFEMAFLG
jgi:hypothetical protein